MGINIVLPLLLVVAALSLVDLCHGEIIDRNDTVEGGQFRYFYDTAMGAAACQNVILLGVGTAMSVNDYKIISNDIVTGQNIVTIVYDFAAGFPFKNSEEGYIKVINAIVAELHTLVPICNDPLTTNRTIIVGGHSASGGATWKCLKKLNFIPNGFLGLDPYKLDPNGATQAAIPTLNIGFTKSTCLVCVDKAAMASYNTSGKDHRVLYLINNSEKNGKKDVALHCSFTDRGCMGFVCPSREGDASVRALVGFSIQAFVKSLATGVYNKQDFVVQASATSAMEMPVTYELYVNQDEVVTSSERKRGYSPVQVDVAFA